MIFLIFLHWTIIQAVLSWNILWILLNLQTTENLHIQCQDVPLPLHRVLKYMFLQSKKLVIIFTIFFGLLEDPEQQKNSGMNSMFNVDKAQAQAQA